MRYKLSADTIRMELAKFFKDEVDLLWQRDLEVRVSIGTDPVTGRDTFRVDLLNPPEYSFKSSTPINSITVDLYRPARSLEQELLTFATTVKHQLKLML